MTLSSWTECDTVATPGVTETTGTVSLHTTVLANDPVLSDNIRAATPAQMVLAESGGVVYLIYDGVRAAIDLHDPAVVNALRLQDAAIRPVSVGALNAFPLVAPIRAVPIAGAGEISPVFPPGRIGSIVKTVDSRGEHLYVVLSEGLQSISAATADIIRYSAAADQAVFPQDARGISPALLAGVPIVHSLPVDSYPTTSPEVEGINPDRVVCMAWQRSNTAVQATTRLLIGNRLPLSANVAPVRLATADGNGPGIDSVYLKAGTGEFVQATGSDTGSRRMGQLFYVSDTGLRYHIKDLPTAAALGVAGVKDPDRDDEVPQAAPWSIVSLLPAGPELSQQAALIAHDGMAADPAGLKVAQPQS
jgi:type VII secretion protein EccB